MNTGDGSYICNRAWKDLSHFIEEKYDTLLLGIQTLYHKGIVWNYYRVRTAYLVLLSLVATVVVSMVDTLPMSSGLFLSISAITGTGLHTVAMTQLSIPSIIVLGLLMIAGNPVLIVVYVLLYKRRAYRHLCHNIESSNAQIAAEYALMYVGLGITWKVIIMYFIATHILCITLLTIALYTHPTDPEMVERGYSNFAVAVFTIISAHANAGFTLSSTSATYWSNNPFAYIVICIPILAGNTAAPLFLRWTFKAIVRLYEYFHWPGVESYQYVLNHPRRITWAIFGERETEFLLVALLGLNVAQYVIFLSSTLIRPEVRAQYDAQTIAGIGLFQTISTRAAGFEIMDFRALNQGMLVVYVLMMYLASGPFVGTLFASEQSDEVPIVKEEIEDYVDHRNDDDHCYPLTEDSAYLCSEDASQHEVVLTHGQQTSEVGSGSVRFADADTRQGSEAEEQSSVIQQPSLHTLPTEQEDKAAGATSTKPSDDITETSPMLQHITSSTHSSTTSTCTSTPLGRARATSKVPFLVIYQVRPSVGRKFIQQYMLRHTFFILFSIFVIAFIEDHFISSFPAVCNLWYILFEVISAYGNVGISMGVPGYFYSLSGRLQLSSQYILMFLMLLGKHRGLPAHTDTVIDFHFERLRCCSTFKRPAPQDKPPPGPTTDIVTQA